MTPDEIERAISYLAKGTNLQSIDILSVIMLGPDCVEIRAHDADSDQWYADFINRQEWEYETNPT